MPDPGDYRPSWMHECIMPDPGDYRPSWMHECSLKYISRSRNPETCDARKPPCTKRRESQSRLSHGSTSSHENGPLPKRSPGLKLKGPEDERSSSKERSERSCLTGVAPAGYLKRKVCKHDSASSYLAVVKREPKITTLESEYAGLCISSVDSCRPTRLRKLSPPELELRTGDHSLPTELTQEILGRTHWRHVAQLQCELGKPFRDLVSQQAFLRDRPSIEAEYSPIFFTTDDAGDLHWTGFNTSSREWETIPSLNFAKDATLPSPDKDLFKDYLMAGDEGLLSINVGKPMGQAELVVCNPLTRKAQRLPPLKHARHPVLMHFKMDPGSGHYTIVVAGSANFTIEDLSRKTEFYESRTSDWICPDDSDMPGPGFGLKEYQNGVYYTDSTRELLLCVVNLDNRGRGVLAYDLKKKKWEPSSPKFHIPLAAHSDRVVKFLTAQLVKCGDSVFVFSEQDCGPVVFFLIHKLNLGVDVDYPLEEILRRTSPGDRGLMVYPGFTCVAVSDHELSIFDSVKHTMEIIDLDKPTVAVAPLPAPVSTGNKFYSLNPIGFAYRPSFKNNVCPPPDQV